MKIASFADVMAGQEYVEVVCAIKGEVMRKLTLKDDMVHLEAGPDAIDVPLDTPVSYKPWFMDRGSLLFNGNLKLCTELDKIRYLDGTEVIAQPVVEGVAA